jgi:hypothetical protein
MAELRSAKRVSGVLVFATAIAFVLIPRTAAAQLHWDASAQLGVMKRVVVNRAPGGEDVGFGPVGQLAAHVALLPLIHAGAYLGHDISPLAGDRSARNITTFGARGKVVFPANKDIRVWGFLGFGYAIVYQQSYEQTFFVPVPAGGTQPLRGTSLGAGGSFFEIPVGVGASYKLSKPFHLCAELGARVGFANTGSIYEQGPQLEIPNRPNQNVGSEGLDRFGVGLTVGVLVDL